MLMVPIGGVDLLLFSEVDFGVARGRGREKERTEGAGDRCERGSDGEEMPEDAPLSGDLGRLSSCLGREVDCLGEAATRALRRIASNLSRSSPSPSLLYQVLVEWRSSIDEMERGADDASRGVATGDLGAGDVELDFVRRENEPAVPNCFWLSAADGCSWWATAEPSSW